MTTSENNTENTGNSQKGLLEKITDILWKIWNFLLYMIVLPLGSAAIVFTFMLNSGIGLFPGDTFFPWASSVWMGFTVISITYRIYIKNIKRGKEKTSPIIPPGKEFYVGYYLPFITAGIIGICAEIITFTVSGGTIFLRYFGNEGLFIKVIIIPAVFSVIINILKEFNFSGNKDKTIAGLSVAEFSDTYKKILIFAISGAFLKVLTVWIIPISFIIITLSDFLIFICVLIGTGRYRRKLRIFTEVDGWTSRTEIVTEVVINYSRTFALSSIISLTTVYTVPPIIFALMAGINNTLYGLSITIISASIIFKGCFYIYKKVLNTYYSKLGFYPAVWATGLERFVDRKIEWKKEPSEAIKPIIGEKLHETDSAPSFYGKIVSPILLISDITSIGAILYLLFISDLITFCISSLLLYIISLAEFDGKLYYRTIFIIKTFIWEFLFLLSLVSIINMGIYYSLLMLLIGAYTGLSAAERRGMVTYIRYGVVKGILMAGILLMLSLSITSSILDYLLIGVTDIFDATVVRICANIAVFDVFALVLTVRNYKKKMHSVTSRGLKATITTLLFLMFISLYLISLADIYGAFSAAYISVKYTAFPTIFLPICYWAIDYFGRLGIFGPAATLRTKIAFLYLFWSLLAFNGAIITHSIFIFTLIMTVGLRLIIAASEHYTEKYPPQLIGVSPGIKAERIALPLLLIFFNAVFFTFLTEIAGLPFVITGWLTLNISLISVKIRLFGKSSVISKILGTYPPINFAIQIFLSFPIGIVLYGYTVTVLQFIPPGVSPQLYILLLFSMYLYFLSAYSIRKGYTVNPAAVEGISAVFTVFAATVTLLITAILTVLIFNRFSVPFGSKEYAVIGFVTSTVLVVIYYISSITSGILQVGGKKKVLFALYEGRVHIGTDKKGRKNRERILRLFGIKENGEVGSEESEGSITESEGGYDTLREAGWYRIGEFIRAYINSQQYPISKELLSDGFRVNLDRFMGNRAVRAINLIYVFLPFVGIVYYASIFSEFMERYPSVFAVGAVLAVLIPGIIPISLKFAGLIEESTARRIGIIINTLRIFVSAPIVYHYSSVLLGRAGIGGVGRFLLSSEAGIATMIIIMFIIKRWAVKFGAAAYYRVFTALWIIFSVVTPLSVIIPTREFLLDILGA